MTPPKKIRILHLGKYFPPPFGGIESHTVELARELAPSCEVELVVTQRGTAAQSPNQARARSTLPVRHIERCGDGQFVVHQLPALAVLNATAIMPSYPLWLRRHVALGKFDLIHAHLPNPMANLALWAVPRSVPVVISWHSDILRQQLALKFYRPVVRRLIDRAARVIVCTPKHFESSTQLSDRPEWTDKCVSVPYGIAAERLVVTPAVVAAGAQLPVRAAQAVVVLAVGRHVGYKGFDYLIEALPHLHTNAVVWLVGEGPLTPSYRARVKALGVSQRIQFLGALSADQLVAALHACDVFCLPSVSQAEAFGLAAAEAMLCGKPTVVCELNNGVTYLNRHDDTSLVVPPADAPALARALNQLISNQPLRAQMGARAREWVASEFSLERMREGTLAVYRAVLAERAVAALNASQGRK